MENENNLVNNIEEESVGTETKPCPSCGMPVRDGEAFCTSCGSKLSQENEPAESAVPAPRKKPWLKRIISAVLALVIILGGTAGYFYYEDVQRCNEYLKLASEYADLVSRSVDILNSAALKRNQCITSDIFSLGFDGSLDINAIWDSAEMKKAEEINDKILNKWRELKNAKFPRYNNKKIQRIVDAVKTTDSDYTQHYKNCTSIATSNLLDMILTSTSLAGDVRGDVSRLRGLISNF